MKIHEGTILILALVGGVIGILYLTGSMNLKHGFYTADATGHTGVDSSRSYVASSAGVGGA